jgi:hypothetical protein
MYTSFKICSIINFVLPYGFVVDSGKSSLIGTVFGFPYTVAEELKTILLRAEQVSEAYDYKKQCAILEVSPVYIDPSGAYEFPNIQELQETLSHKIDETDRGIVSEQYTLDDKDDFLNKIKEEQKKV